MLHMPDALPSTHVSIPVLGVSTKDEETKFETELGSYFKRHRGGHDGDSKESDLHSSIDYEAWALDWNNFITSMEQGQEPLVNITRKSANLLKSFHTKRLSEHNRRLTMAVIRPQHVELLSQLHHAISCRGNDLDVGHAVGKRHSIESDRNVTSPLAQEQLSGGAENEFVSIPPHQDADQAKEVAELPNTSHPEPKRRKRNPQICQKCGHARHLGRWGNATYHDRNASANQAAFCAVPPENWMPANVRVKGWCDCQDCDLRAYGILPSTR